jgi:uncharacterized delta-60 repeat protein
VTRALLLLALLVALSAGVAHAAPGALDPGFDGDGKRTLGAGVGRAVLVQPDGKILVAGHGGPGLDMLVTRLLPDGSPDPGFGTGGTAVADFGGDDQAHAAALQPDGRIVVAGGTSGGARTGAAVARFDERGGLDATFDAGGVDGAGRKVFEDPTGNDAEFNAALVQPDGRIVLAGYAFASNEESHNFAIRRLEPSGAEDGTVFESADFDGGTDSAEGVALLPDGRLVAAGSSFSGERFGEMAVARYDADGKLDTTFGGTGTRTIGSEAADEARAVLAQPDGGIVVVGTRGANFDADLAVARMRPDGTLDPAFGDGGVATRDFGGGELGTSAALQPDGKILVAGLTTEFDFAVARFLPGGALDAGFGSGGLSQVSFGGIDLAWAIALQPDGRILVAGQAFTSIGVARLLPDPPVVPPDGDGPPTGTRKPDDPGARPRCAGRAATIVGTTGRDVLRGTRGADVIVALGGVDVVRAGGGADRVCGGAGADRVRGGEGRDVLRGGAGEDRVRGGEGRDALLGGAGGDRMRGDEGRDRVLGGAGDDWLRGDVDRDDVLGGPGHDHLAGDQGRDDVVGGPGQDTCADNRAHCEIIGWRGR